MITLTVTDLVLIFAATAGLMIIGSVIDMMHERQLQQQITHRGLDPDQLEGPPPWDPGHALYMTDLEHATIRPLGTDPQHCDDCLGYDVAHPGRRSLDALTGAAA